MLIKNQEIEDETKKTTYLYVDLKYIFGPPQKEILGGRGGVSQAPPPHLKDLGRAH